MTLSASGISVHFGGVKALSAVDLAVERGSIVGLVGPNGAGKSTLFNCLTGVVRPDAGLVHLAGSDISTLAIDSRVRLGIARTFQTPRFDPAGSVLDAVKLGFYPQVKQSMISAFLPLARTRREEAEIDERARLLISQFQLTDDPLVVTGELSLGRLRLLEVARALASDPKFILLDEPAAGTSSHDRELLADAIRHAASQNIGILLVEHSVSFVSALSDRMVALIGGCKIAEGPPDDVIRDPRVVAAYLGAAHAAAHH